MFSDDAAEVVGRPDAPYDLTDEQAQEWRALVALLPVNWFPRETHALLTGYCRHVVAQRKIAMLIDAMESSKGPPAPLRIDAYDKLLKMQDRESRTIAALMRAMRITQQSLYDKSRKKDATAGITKPWATKD